VIGNPQGYENTISDGLLSQIRDSGEGYSLHQISAPISAGSSGSPVFNQKGEVIGIATLSNTLGQNLNFSVPINYARGMIDGPIKYSLKEFSGLVKEPTLLSEIAKPNPAENAKVLEKINNYIIALFAAWDGSIMGFDITAEPHMRIFNASKYRISPLITTANQSLIILQQELNALACSDSVLQSLKEALLSATVLSIESSNKLVETLENAYPNPNWSKAVSGMEGITMALQRKIDKEFVVTFMEYIRKEDPQLESYVIPRFFETYENKDKSPEEIAAQATKRGHLMIEFQLSTRIPIIGRVKKDGPADRANVRRGDIILGVVNGPEFKTQMDYKSFLNTTKPGETYTYKISSNGQVKSVVVKLS
jgi:S1-C subfamily serine protease